MKTPPSFLFRDERRVRIPRFHPSSASLRRSFSAVWGLPSSLGGGLSHSDRPAHTMPGSLSVTRDGSAVRVVALTEHNARRCSVAKASRRREDRERVDG